MHHLHVELEYQRNLEFELSADTLHHRFYFQCPTKLFLEGIRLVFQGIEEAHNLKLIKINNFLALTYLSVSVHQYQNTTK